MLILLEGPDGAGKTSFAAELADTIGNFNEVRVLHKGPPTSGPIEEYIGPLFDYMPGSGETIICDRWHVGEQVYPHILGRKTELTMLLLDQIEEFLNSLGALLIHVTAHTEDLIKHVTERGDDLIDVSMLATISQEYYRVMRVSRMTRATYNTSRDMNAVPISYYTDLAYMLEQKAAATRLAHVEKTNGN